MSEHPWFTNLIRKLQKELDFPTSLQISKASYDILFSFFLDILERLGKKMGLIIIIRTMCGGYSQEVARSDSFRKTPTNVNPIGITWRA